MLFTFICDKILVKNKSALQIAFISTLDVSFNFVNSFRDFWVKFSENAFHCINYSQKQLSNSSDCSIKVAAMEDNLSGPL